MGDQDDFRSYTIDLRQDKRLNVVWKAKIEFGIDMKRRGPYIWDFLGEVAERSKALPC
ncbi:hypothetical protein [Halalkalibaculum sp. DA384]|uniref:hypothetical protein n=1 Tax=Halalkalibaculum sp. DA384 TaxID=3373606 RepID=UPI0037544207